MSEGLVDQGGDGDRFKANLEVPSVALRHLGGENLGTVPEIKLHNIDDFNNAVAQTQKCFKRPPVRFYFFLSGKHRSPP